MAIAAFRYNNPFNISLPRSGYYGGSVVGLPGQPGYAAFPTMASGYAAGSQRLTDYISGNTKYGTLDTIGTLGPVYATDPNWAAGVSKASGIPVNQTLDPNNPTQMAALQQGILTQEIGPQNAANLAGQYGGSGSGYGVQLADASGANVSSGLSAGTGLSGGTLGDTFSGVPYSTDPTFADRFPGSGGSPSADFSGLSGGTDITAGNFAGSNPTGGFDPNATSFGPSTGGFDASIPAGDIASPSTAASGAPGAIGNPAGDVNPADPSGGTATGQGTGPPINVGFQMPLVKDIGDWVANVEKAFGSGLTSALTAGETAVANFFGGITNWFVRAGLIFLGILLIIVGLVVLMWDHGGEQLAVKSMKVIAA